MVPGDCHVASLLAMTVDFFDTLEILTPLPVWGFFVGKVNGCLANDGYAQLPITLSFRGPLGPWESPGTMFVTAQQVDEWYQEIATSLRSSQ